MHDRAIQCLFCDDVRTEVGRKLSFMGVYGDDVVLPIIPMELPKFNIVVLIDTASENRINSLALVLSLPTGEDLKIPVDSAAVARSPVNYSDANRLQYRALFVASPFEVPSEGRLAVRVEIDGVVSGIVGSIQFTVKTHSGNQSRMEAHRKKQEPKTVRRKKLAEKV
jgi:hypothetical protein